MKSLGQSVFGLANILFVACFAGNAIDQVRALAGDVVFSSNSFTCLCTGEMVYPVDNRAEHALKVSAFFLSFGEVTRR